MILLTMDEFGVWLQSELDRREWTQADFARRSGMNTSQVSYLINGTRKLGLSSAITLSEALRVPIETVLVEAGHISRPKANAQKENQLLHLFRLLPDHEQDRTIAYVEGVLNLLER